MIRGQNQIIRNINAAFRTPANIDKRIVNSKKKELKRSVIKDNGNKNLHFSYKYFCFDDCILI